MATHQRNLGVLHLAVWVMFVSDLAKKFAERLESQTFTSDDERINAMYLAVYGRPAQAEEIQERLEFLTLANAAAATARLRLGGAPRAAANRGRAAPR